MWTTKWQVASIYFSEYCGLRTALEDSIAVLFYSAFLSHELAKIQHLMARKIYLDGLWGTGHFWSLVEVIPWVRTVKKA